MTLMAIGQAAWAVEPLVDAAWVNAHLDNKDIRILDLQRESDYMQGHISGAVHTRYSDWRKTDQNGIPGMLPPAAYLEGLIGSLGIDNHTHVVLVPPGQHAGDLAMATRVYWTTKVAGYDAVSILNGGMADYRKAPSASVDRAEVIPGKKIFKVFIRRGDTPVAGDVLQALNSDSLIVDSRSPGEYVGSPSDRTGSMPGALNLPYSWLTEKGAGRFPDQSRLKFIFKEMGVPTTGDQIHFCHTGHRASLSWFVSHELLGNLKAKMYDGSMAEWSNNPDLPMVFKTQAER